MRVIAIVSIAGLSACAAEADTRRDLLLATGVSSSADVRAAGMSAGPSVAPCLSYQDTVTLEGRLRREVFPGPPNHESVAAGDTPETGYYLDLPTPVCGRSSIPARGDASLEPVDDVREIQLILDSAGFARLGPQLGREAVVRGSALAAHTGHHHAPMLLWVIW